MLLNFPFQNNYAKKLALRFARVDVVKTPSLCSVVPIWNGLPTNLVVNPFTPEVAIWPEDKHRKR